MLDGHIHISQSADQPRDMRRSLAKAGISGGILISICPNSFNFGNRKKLLATEDRLDELFAWINVNDGLHPFFWIDPTEDDALEQVCIADARNVAGFKIICNSFLPSDQRAVRVYNAIAELGKPVLFHSGILWDGAFSSRYNRPAEFEILLGIKGLRFALAHISWPWCDECIALYGKFDDTKRRRPGYSTEMFIDITPGTPPIYRKDALTKLFGAGYPVCGNVLFGLDQYISAYDSNTANEMISRDNFIFDELNIGDDGKENIFGGNLKRFLGI